MNGAREADERHVTQLDTNIATAWAMGETCAGSGRFHGLDIADGK